MADLFYGASMKISDATKAIKAKPDFIHFMFHVHGNGSGNFVLACFAVYGPDRMRTYDKFELEGSNEAPWSEPGKTHFLPKMIMDYRTFLMLTPPDVTSTSILIEPKEIQSQHQLDYEYLVYYASTVVAESGAPISVGLNPSPPY